MGVLGIFKFRGKKWWASLALGQSIIAKKSFGIFWAIAKANFPEIPFPPPGGNKFPGGPKNKPPLFQHPDF